MSKIPQKPIKNVPVNMSLVDDKRKEEIREEVKEQVKAEQKKRAEEVFRLQALSEARGEQDKIQDAFMEEPVDIHVELAPNCANANDTGHIIIDNIRYDNGRNYTVSRGKAETILYAMYKTWEHEFIVMGKQNELRHRTLSHVMGNGMGVMRPGVTAQNVINSTTSIRG